MARGPAVNYCKIYAPDPQAAYGLWAEVTSKTDVFNDFPPPLRTDAPPPQTAAERAAVLEMAREPQNAADNGRSRAREGQADRKGKGVDRRPQTARPQAKESPFFAPDGPTPTPVPGSPTNSEHYWADGEASPQNPRTTAQTEEPEDPTTPKAQPGALPPSPTTPTAPQSPPVVYAQRGTKRVRIETPTPSPRRPQGAPVSMLRRGTISAAASAAPLPRPSWLMGPGTPGALWNHGRIGDRARTLRGMRTAPEESDEQGAGDSGGKQSTAEFDGQTRM